MRSAHCSLLNDIIKKVRQGPLQFGKWLGTSGRRD